MILYTILYCVYLLKQFLVLMVDCFRIHLLEKKNSFINIESIIRCGIFFGHSPMAALFFQYFYVNKYKIQRRLIFLQSFSFSLFAALNAWYRFYAIKCENSLIIIIIINIHNVQKHNCLQNTRDYKKLWIFTDENINYARINKMFCLYYNFFGENITIYYNLW